MNKRVVYILLCLGCVTISFNVAAIAAVIPVMSKNLGLQDFLVSRIIPYYLVPYGIGALIYAPLTRYFSYRSILIVSMILYSLSCFMCGAVASLNYLLIGRIGMGLAGASIIPLGLMIIGEFFEKGVRGRLVGFFFTCSFFASLAGIAMSGFLHWQWLFYVPAMLGIAMVIGTAFLGGELLKKVHGVSVNYLHVIHKPVIYKVFGYIFCISFLYHGVHKWYGVYLSQVYGLDKMMISFFFIVSAIGGAVGQMTGGYLSDKIGRLVAWYIGLIGLALTTMFLIGYHSSIVLGFILFGISMFWTIGHNGVLTVLTDFPDEDRPMVASLNSSVRFISGGIGFFVSSLFVTKSFGVTFFVIGILMFMLSFFLKHIIPRH